MTISLPSPVNRATKARTLGRLGLVLAILLGALSGSQAAGAAEPWDRVLSITFPTTKGARFGNDYAAPRSGGARMHCGTDIIGPKRSPVYAARGGKITFMPTTKPSYGYTINVAGDDGRRYSYLHLNDDLPGTESDTAGPEHAYAPGLRVGSIVARGQLIGYMGDSGNAEGGVNHIHFEIHDPAINNPACTNGGGPNRANPYHSLANAVAHNDFGGKPANPPSPPARTIDLACPTARVASASFPDVAGTHARAIDCAAWWRVVAGSDDGTYRPNQPVNREQLAAMIVRMFDSMGKPLPPSPVDHFTDDDTSAQQDAINRLANAWILTGSSPGHVNPGGSVSRAQMATILTRAYGQAAGQVLPAGPNTFTDDNGNVHEPAINQLAAARIVVGADAVTYNPQQPVTRAQMAAFVSRTLDVLVEKRATTLPR